VLSISSRILYHLHFNRCFCGLLVLYVVALPGVRSGTYTDLFNLAGAPFRARSSKGQPSVFTTHHPRHPRQNQPVYSTSYTILSRKNFRSLMEIIIFAFLILLLLNALGDSFLDQCKTRIKGILNGTETYRPINNETIDKLGYLYHRPVKGINSSFPRENLLTVMKNSRLFMSCCP